MHQRLKNLILAAAVVTSVPCLPAQMTFHPESDPEKIAGAALAGEYITLKTIVFKGDPAACARYTVPQGCGVFTEGIILSTGKARDAAGPNNHTQTSGNLQSPGTQNLDIMSHGRTFDAAVLNITFVPELDSVSFSFIFASEEYNEGVNNTFNDAVLIEVSGQGLGSGINLATLPDDKGILIPVNIQNVNVQKNRNWYVDNNPFKLNGERDPVLEKKLNAAVLKAVQYDGFTKPRKTGFRVKPGSTYTMRISIGDGGDGNYDSALLLESFSLEGLEQKWHEDRRRELALEALRLDSLRLADSLAQVKAASSGTSPATVAGASPGEHKLMLLPGSGGSVFSNSADIRKVDSVASLLIDRPELRAAVYVCDPANPAKADAAADEVMRYLYTTGIQTSQVFRSYFTFRNPGESLPIPRIEIWVRPDK